MRFNVNLRVLLIGIGILAIAVSILWVQSPTIAANSLLHPLRVPVNIARPSSCKDIDFTVKDGVKDRNLILKGWECQAKNRSGNSPKESSNSPDNSSIPKPRGTIIFLHGVANNRLAGIKALEEFAAKGFKAIAYDSRANGESDGENCTYGYFEKEDLQVIVSSVKDYPIILMGTSMGAAVALQALEFQAAENDSRVLGIMAAESFSDLRTVVRDRAPNFLSDEFLNKGFKIAEAKSGFVADEVNPVKAAKGIRASVLLIHGAEDRDTRPEHSQRIFEALNSPKQIILVAGKRHNESLDGEEVWDAIEKWVEDLLPTQAAIQK
jgi:uncharacterized protein